MSPPVRGRGLKLLTVGENRTKTMSPPVRGRGLKRDLEVCARRRDRRPPCGGAD